MTDKPLRMLILGAHPDDAEYHAGGLAAMYRELGHVVKMISVTDGGAGHHSRSGRELIEMRRNEAAAAGAVIGAEYLTWGNPDGSLQPTLEVRWQVIREIRTFAPDLVLTHRTNDYHPDHRAVGQLVQDASYMVTVPNVLPEVPALRKDPIVAYMADTFTRPCPLEPDVVIDVTDHIETIAQMLDKHCSQVYEWLPYNEGVLEQVPADEKARYQWLKEWFVTRTKSRVEHFMPQLIATYGEERAKQVKYVEAYEISEYAGDMDEEARRRLFPMVK